MAVFTMPGAPASIEALMISETKPATQPELVGAAGYNLVVITIGILNKKNAAGRGRPGFETGGCEPCCRCLGILNNQHDTAQAVAQYKWPGIRYSVCTSLPQQNER